MQAFCLYLHREGGGKRQTHTDTHRHSQTLTLTLKLTLTHLPLDYLCCCLSVACAARVLQGVPHKGRLRGVRPLHLQAQPRLWHHVVKQSLRPWAAASSSRLLPASSTAITSTRSTYTPIVASHASLTPLSFTTLFPHLFIAPFSLTPLCVYLCKMAANTVCSLLSLSLSLSFFPCVCNSFFCIACCSLFVHDWCVLRLPSRWLCFFLFWFFVAVCVCLTHGCAAVCSPSTRCTPCLTVSGNGLID